MLSSRPNGIIWCYHVILSSGMITPPFLFFLKTSLTHETALWLCVLLGSNSTEVSLAADLTKILLLADPPRYCKILLLLLYMRSKIRQTECNAKCRYLKKFTCKGTLHQVFYLSEAQYTIPPPPPYTLYTCIQYTYSHREGVGGVESKPKRMLGGAMFHKAGGKYQHEWVYLQSINSVKHQSRPSRVWCLYCYLVHGCMAPAYDGVARVKTAIPLCLLNHPTGKWYSTLQI